MDKYGKVCANRKVEITYLWFMPQSLMFFTFELLPQYSIAQDLLLKYPEVFDEGLMYGLGFESIRLYLN